MSDPYEFIAVMTFVEVAQTALICFILAVMFGGDNA